jgi:membrane fusion protein, multidrug efflux system
MKKIINIFILALLIITLMTISSCTKSGGDNKTEKNQAINIKVEQIKAIRLVDAIQVAGTVKAMEDANISPEEGGVVKEWKAIKGQHVKKGDLIVVLRDEVIKAGYDAGESQYKLAELNLEKQQKVFDEQGISELQYKNILYTRDGAKANYDLMKARWERTQIRSPFDGTVETTIPNEGEYAPPGVPIARVVNTSTIKIQAEVPEMYSGTVLVGSPVAIFFDALPGDTLRGKISFVGSTVSTANRTLMVEIILQNPLKKLKPEMVAKVQISREVKNNAILISENIIQLVDRDRSIVYVENNGIAEERKLKLGGREGILVEILEGLKSGDKLIVSGYQKLVNGSPVVVVQ